MKITFSILLIVVFTLSCFSQRTEEERKWNAPVEPFRIIGNVYYVGAADITSFLITTPQGHILLDGGFAETAPMIKENIKKLGFKINDVKFLINSQAHYDHAAGLAEMKRATNAKMLVSAADKILLENGGKGDFHFGDRMAFDPVTVDKIIKDREKIRLGGINLIAVLTPGHTKGCTTWLLEVKEDNRKYTVIFVGSTTVPGYKLNGNENYPNIVSDYEKTFRTMKKLKPNVFLGSHGSFFDLLGKAERLKKGESINPFIDPEGYRNYLENTEKSFRDKLVKN